MIKYQPGLSTLIFSFIFISTSLMYSQNKVISLWDKIPGSIESVDYKEEPRLDAQGNITGIRKVAVPTLKVFLANNTNVNNSAVIPFMNIN
jgi:hypothetical protein